MAAGGFWPVRLGGRAGGFVVPQTPFFSRFGKRQSVEEWEQTLATDIERAIKGEPADVRLIIPAHQTELGKRLELASRSMRQKGYRLRQVSPESSTTWAASFMKMED